jgi:hypothetical protein
MRTRGVRVGIAVTALAAAVVVFVVLAGADDTETDAATPQPESAQVTTAASESPDPQSPTIPRIVVRDGTPVGGVARLEYESGERVGFIVLSDVADEVHVHGFDITKAVPADESVRFDFPADLEGVFDVELHDSDIKLAELRIEP